MNKIILEATNLKKNFKHASGIITLFDNFNIKIKEGLMIVN